MTVSKLKSAPMLMEAYKAGQIHFGENYVDELVEKSRKVLAPCFIQG
ncbi:MAG: hypothetical protein P4M11_13800 [Candidatus Pacebacteria bacterium]|nr:hypothetical protein [Candidatus Paceibacterota bacterium]